MLFLYFVYIFISQVIFRRLLSEHPNDNIEPNLLCVDNDFALVAPNADGYFMRPDVKPSEWTLYESRTMDQTDERIFFHETSGRHDLSMRQCCAIESAAKHHPHRIVQLFLRPPIRCSSRSHGSSDRSLLFYNPTWLKVLSKYPNIKIVLVNEYQYFHGSPLENWYNQGKWRQSRFETAHLSDYIRILNLHKGGGLYLDMDIITMKPYKGEQFRNFLVYGNEAMEEISNGAMHLERGHWLSTEVMELIAKEYDPEAYVYHGPDAVSEVINRVCGLKAQRPETNQCDDIHVLPDRFFYPIPSIFSHLLFQDNGNKTDEEMAKIKKVCFGLHFWNSITRSEEPLRIDSNQIVAIVARQNCPITAAAAADFQVL